jgi:hypothetical protein
MQGGSKRSEAQKHPSPRARALVRRGTRGGKVRRERGAGTWIDLQRALQLGDALPAGARAPSGAPLRRSVPCPLAADCRAVRRAARGRGGARLGDDGGRLLALLEHGELEQDLPTRARAAAAVSVGRRGAAGGAARASRGGAWRRRGREGARPLPRDAGGRARCGGRGAAHLAPLCERDVVVGVRLHLRASLRGRAAPRSAPGASSVEDQDPHAHLTRARRREEWRAAALAARAARSWWRAGGTVRKVMQPTAWRASPRGWPARSRDSASARLQTALAERPPPRSAARSARHGTGVAGVARAHLHEVLLKHEGDLADLARILRARHLHGC